MRREAVFSPLRRCYLVVHNIDGPGGQAPLAAGGWQGLELGIMLLDAAIAYAGPCGAAA